MAIIQFTTLQYEKRVVRRYGEFSLVATPDDCHIQGFKETEGAFTGDREFEVIVEALRAAWLDHCRLAGNKPTATQFPAHDIKGGTMVHPKRGAVAGYRAEGIVIKCEKKRTVITATEFHIVNEEHLERVCLALMEQVVAGRRFVDSYRADIAA